MNLNHPPELVDAVAARIRDLVRVHPGPSASRTLQAGDPIILSGREAEVAAFAALEVLGPELERAAELEAEGLDKMAERLLDETRLRALQIREGKAELDVEPAQELAAIWVGCARTMLGGAENYSETPVEFEVGLAGQPDRYALIVQRVGKLTPHQARLRAEERADEAEARARAAERETARLRAALSKERASRGANGSGTALYQLRAAVLAEPGAWTPARVRAALDGNTSTVRVPEARRLLGQLADEGLLVRPAGPGQPWAPTREAEHA
ncbi:hypothetical protein [Actinomadura madurae]|uniref:hypothetical protein n=1 Tax=Actinomadura madurae TaxID=1993 RepID=UPI0020D23334|nr:hypothetical protein [Actinomadura madurae]MCP9964108.1 hypothetical protein [Actinomadura madurae]MCQ0011923.1 hypothetical protein [Actinomadura madurae]